MHRMTSNTLAALRLAAVLTLLAWPPVSAQEQTLGVLPEPSAEAGLALAERLCRDCHLVGGEAPLSVVVGIPSLRFIANRSGQTAERIEGVLISPHAPMPDMKLTVPEIRDLIAYLDTLRSETAGPRLMSPSPIKDKLDLPKPG